MSRTVLKAVVFAVALLLAGPALAEDFAIVGAQVFPAPDAAPIANGTVVVHDGRITAVGPRGKVKVPEGTRIIDGKDHSVTAGFWNSHVHLMSPPFHQPGAQTSQALQDALRDRFGKWGFTTLFDIGSLPGDVGALRTRMAKGEVQGPRLLTVDMPFYPEHGTPIYVRELWAETRTVSAEVATPNEARERADAQLDAGADGVKVFTGAIVGGPQGVLPMRVDVASAAVTAAHAHGKPAFAHPTNMAGLEVAVASGVDVLAHTAPDAGPWSPELVARLKAKHMALVPTLSLFDAHLRQEGVPDEVVKRFVGNAQQQVKAMADGGGQVLFGTDAGYTEVYDTRLEYRLMAAAGLDWRQILTSLTTAPASRFGDATQRGRLAEGYAADLVLLGSDPQQSTEAFADVAMTVREGNIIYSSR
ncbi:amidohydrolase family protein [uncultured Stenotrophomonas sp.]|uniref:amidohydrolase family protein n=1 Tax=uncultured Stenotrophomonas sp. TaxID=165438 RepID=UPI0028EEAAB6|nr:amidohydrolase family protein [uncultured Stenotrophomonas sp.]